MWGWQTGRRLRLVFLLMPKECLGPWRLSWRSHKENLRTHLPTKHWIVNAVKVSTGDGMGIVSQQCTGFYMGIEKEESESWFCHGGEERVKKREWERVGGRNRGTKWRKQGDTGVGRLQAEGRKEEMRGRKTKWRDTQEETSKQNKRESEPRTKDRCRKQSLSGGMSCPLALDPDIVQVLNVGGRC